MSKWGNKHGKGELIELENGNKIKVVTWYHHNFTEIELMNKNRKTLYGGLAYSENEINKMIEFLKTYKFVKTYK